MKETIQSELRDLLAALSAGEISLREAQRLDELVNADPAARRAYLDTMAVEAELHAMHSFDGAALLPADSLPRPHWGLIHKLSKHQWLALACSFLGIAVLSSLMTSSLLEVDQQVAVKPSEELHRTAVGAVSATRNCRWASPNGGCGDLVYRGQQLSLQHGVAEIAFNCGATVLLEGPARLDIDSNGGLLLRSGRLAVHSPEDLESLPIRAGRIRIVEQGASYGLIAEASGKGEVHVFDGIVRAVLFGKSGQRIQTCKLTGGHGGRLDTRSNELQPIAAHGDLFVRSLSPGVGPRDGLYAMEGFDYAAGPLNEQNGGFGWAGPWTDIETAESPSGDSTNRVEQRSLAWPGVPPAGNRAIQLGQNNRIRRALSTSVKGVFDAAGYVENRDAQRLIGQQGKTIYLAFLQRASQLDDVFYGLELNRGDGNFNRVLCLGNGVEESGYAATSDFNNLTNRKSTSLGEENTEVNFLIVRIDYGKDNHDTVTVYRNPASLLEEKACQPTAVLRGDFAFDRISLGNFNGSKRHEIDEIRLGGDFRVVTGQRSFIQGQLALGSSPQFGAGLRQIMGRREPGLRAF